MYIFCKQENSDYLSGRTKGGISRELYWHYVSFDKGILSKQAEYANIGGLDKTKPGYDSNGFLFE